MNTWTARNGLEMETETGGHVIVVMLSAGLLERGESLPHFFLSLFSLCFVISSLFSLFSLFSGFWIGSCICRRSDSLSDSESLISAIPVLERWLEALEVHDDADHGIGGVGLLVINAMHTMRWDFAVKLQSSNAMHY